MVEQPQQSQPQQANENPGTTFGKLKQTLSSSLLTAQDKGETLTYISENGYYVTNLRNVGYLNILFQKRYDIVRTCY